MTSVGWLADQGNADGTKGGAELTQEAFKQAAPEGVEVVDCPPGGVIEGLDKYVIHNCVSYSAVELPLPAFKMWHDVGPHIPSETWERLFNASRPICVSPLQQHKMESADLIPPGAAHLIPPPISLDRFRKAAENAGERKGAVALGPWMNWDKTPHAAAEWARGNGGIDFYGGGPFAPPGSPQVDYEDLPELLARYKTFVHLPRTLEPCGRSVIEAWAAGCQIVTNKLVGARHWIVNEPDKLDTAAEDLWALILQ